MQQNYNFEKSGSDDSKEIVKKILKSIDNGDEHETQEESYSYDWSSADPIRVEVKDK